MSRLAILLLAIVLGSGCSILIYTAPNLDRVSIGMTKAEVIQAIGRPSTVAAINGTEILSYNYDKFGDAPRFIVVRTCVRQNTPMPNVSVNAEVGKTVCGAF